MDRQNSPGFHSITGGVFKMTFSVCICVSLVKIQPASQPGHYCGQVCRQKIIFSIPIYRSVHSHLHWPVTSSFFLSLLLLHITCHNKNGKFGHDFHLSKVLVGLEVFEINDSPILFLKLQCSHLYLQLTRGHRYGHFPRQNFHISNAQNF